MARGIAGLDRVGHDPHVAVPLGVVPGFELLAILVEGLVLDLAAAEESARLGLELLAQLGLEPGGRALEHDPRDLEPFTLLDREPQHDLVGTGRAVDRGVHLGAREALIAVELEQRVDLGLDRPGGADLAGVDAELLLELRGLLAVIARDLDLRDPRPFLDVDQEIENAVVLVLLDPDVAEQAESDQLDDAAPDRVGRVARSGRNAERAHDAIGLGDRVADDADLPDQHHGPRGHLGGRRAGAVRDRHRRISVGRRGPNTRDRPEPGEAQQEQQPRGMDASLAAPRAPGPPPHPAWPGPRRWRA